ncbi:hypothetical protein OQA88_5435 [Cercophora sp. LCS_1]
MSDEAPTVPGAPTPPVIRKFPVRLRKSKVTDELTNDPAKEPPKIPSPNTPSPNTPAPKTPAPVDTSPGGDCWDSTSTPTLAGDKTPGTPYISTPGTVGNETPFIATPSTVGNETPSRNSAPASRSSGTTKAKSPPSTHPGHYEQWLSRQMTWDYIDYGRIFADNYETTQWAVNHRLERLEAHRQMRQYPCNLGQTQIRVIIDPALPPDGPCPLMTFRQPYFPAHLVRADLIDITLMWNSLKDIAGFKPDDPDVPWKCAFLPEGMPPEGEAERVPPLFYNLILNNVDDLREMIKVIFDKVPLAAITDPRRRPRLNMVLVEKGPTGSTRTRDLSDIKEEEEESRPASVVPVDRDDENRSGGNKAYDRGASMGYDVPRQVS